jgi:hypothetical protein
MNLLELTILFLTVCLLILLNSSNAFACSCAAKPSVLEYFEGSELVIIVKAVSVEMREEAKGVDLEAKMKESNYDISYQYVKSTKMKVEKVYKGNVKVGDELLFGQGGGADCRWTFGIKAVGKNFLFYLDKPTKYPYGDDNKMSDQPAYFPITCGRSQQIVGYETDDLKYLNKIDQVKGKTRISGELDCWYLPCPEMANITITIFGENKRFETKTDEKGIYEIYDLPPGKYFLKPEIQKGWKVDESMLRYSPAFRRNEYFLYDEEADFSKGIPINLEAGRHSGIDFYFVLDSAIRGKVLSPEGKPMKGVCVNAVSTELKEGDYRGQSDCTDYEGVFVISRLPPRKYILVANNEGKISAHEPFGTLFYGNTTKYSEAKSFEIKLGDHLDGFTIQIPKTEELVTIKGKLIYSNGVPVTDEWMKFDIDEKNRNIDGAQTIKTDKEGDFSFKVLKDFEGKLFGEIYVYDNKFKDCPQFFAQIKKKLNGKNSGEIKTEKVTIDATKDISNLVVKFDFPGCEKVSE